MKKGLALVAGLICVAPFLSLLIIPAVWPRTSSSNRAVAEAQSDLFHNILVVDISLVYLLVLVLVIYTFTTSWVPKGKRALWVTVLFFGNMFVFPVFWFHYIWRAYGSERKILTNAS